MQCYRHRYIVPVPYIQKNATITAAHFRVTALRLPQRSDGINCLAVQCHCPTSEPSAFSRHSWSTIRCPFVSLTSATSHNKEFPPPVMMTKFSWPHSQNTHSASTYIILTQKTFHLWLDHFTSLFRQIFTKNFSSYIPKLTCHHEWNLGKFWTSDVFPLTTAITFKGQRRH